MHAVAGQQLADVADLGYTPIVILLTLVVAVGIVIMLLTHLIPKAKRSGDIKDTTYESGMPPIGDARRRFNVKFYLVAMMFLIFDVELIFAYPWAVAFIEAKSGRDTVLAADAPMLFGVMAVFFLILIVGFAYEWGKGVLRYD